MSLISPASGARATTKIGMANLIYNIKTPYLSAQSCHRITDLYYVKAAHSSQYQIPITLNGGITPGRRLSRVGRHTEGMAQYRPAACERPLIKAGPRVST